MKRKARSNRDQSAGNRRLGIGINPLFALGVRVKLQNFVPTLCQSANLDWGRNRRNAVVWRFYFHRNYGRLDFDADRKGRRHRGDSLHVLLQKAPETSRIDPGEIEKLWGIGQDVRGGIDLK